jgi:starvation-inducible DNA-binding protein
MSRFLIPGFADARGAGNPGAIIADRTWNDYSLGRDVNGAHMAALDLVYTGIVDDTRTTVTRLEDLDWVTQGLLIAHAAELENFQWFIRAHPENAGGGLASAGTKTEKAAARGAIDAA